MFPEALVYLCESLMTFLYLGYYIELYPKRNQFYLTEPPLMTVCTTCTGRTAVESYQ